jgi:hypothetical protein
MGVNICVVNRSHKEHPDWDAFRYAGDKEFAAMISEFPSTEENWGSQPDFDWHIRPTDFHAWRAKLAEREWPNPGRLEALVDLLEREPDYWIRFSW